MPRRNTLASNRSRIVGPSENPNGFVSQTPNETVRYGNSEIDSQYAYDLQADGPWSAPAGGGGVAVAGDVSAAHNIRWGNGGAQTVGVQPVPETVVRRRRG